MTSTQHPVPRQHPSPPGRADLTAVPALPHRPGLTQEDTFLVRLAHRSMREDVAALVGALAAVPSGSRRMPRRMEAWFAELRAVLAHHQMEEDEIFFPAVAAAHEGFAALVPTLAADHRALDDAVEHAAAALAAFAATGAGPEQDAAVRAARRLADVLGTHLDLEDRTYVETYQACIDADGHAELSKAALDSAPSRLMAFIGPWLLDHASPADQARLVAMVPKPVAWMLQGPMAVRYRRLARDVRAARADG